MFSLSELQSRIQDRRGGLTPIQPGAALCVAFSGGLDSTVLLHAFARLAAGDDDYRVRAVHVDHGLHADSTLWRDHCARQAQALNVEFTSIKVDVLDRAELGLEAAARDARYGAFSENLRDGEFLLSAHHADDQLETLLLALMRGAGVIGLAAMRAMEPLARGWLARPLLSFTRAELEEWARAEGLQWLTDPSNDNLALDRNFMRHRVVTSLRERWPSVARTTLRSTRHLQEAAANLEQLAELDATDAIVEQCLSVERWAALVPERRRNLLRYWIRRRGARVPSTRKLAAIEHDMLAASADRVPCMEWDGWEIRRHRGLLHCEPQRPALNAEQTLQWQTTAALTLPAELGRLRIEPTQARGLSMDRLAETLTVRFRAGGESLQPVGDGMHRKLKKLLQSAAILPWWRTRLPLIYCGEQLLAVGDLWIAAEFAARDGEAAFTIVWDDKPQFLSRVDDQSGR